MNFVFISPYFPENYWNFCDRLHANGVNVLGIGDAPFDSLPARLKSALTEYYRWKGFLHSVRDLGGRDRQV